MVRDAEAMLAEAMLAEAVGDCMRLAVVRESQENSTHGISMVFIPILCRCLMIVAHMPRRYAIKSRRFDGEVNASISAGCHSDHLSMSHSSSSDVVETLPLSILETAKSTRVSQWIARRFFVDV
jgi:hypothetical protein